MRDMSDRAYLIVLIALGCAYPVIMLLLWIFVGRK